MATSKVKLLNTTDKRKKSKTAIKHSAEKLSEKNSTKDRFFSIIAHDLKDPLNAIIGFSDILSTNFDSLTDTEKKKYLKNINVSSKSLMRLLQNLLEWSQTTHMEFNPQIINVSETANEVVEVLHLQAKHKNIKLRSEIKSNISAIGDINMLKTILRNLISNAIKFTAQGGNITIRAKETKNKENSDGFIEISVSDNGVGIKKENLEKILKLDQKIKTKGTADEYGSGLGLILCKELITKNNGYLVIDSIENSGSTFTFALPKK